MKKRADKIKELINNLNASFEKNRNDCRTLVSSTLEEILSLQEDIQDQRLKRPERRLREALKQIEDLTDIFQIAFGKLKEEAEDLRHALDYSGIGRALSELIEKYNPSLNNFCDSLLDGLIEAVGAERGFLLFYNPASTEAEIAAARNFKSRTLSLEEYNFSLTVLKEVLHRSEPYIIEDAINDLDFSNAASVRRFGIKSVLAVPLKQNGRTLGALYFENNALPRAFDDEDRKVAESASRFAVLYLSNARMLPFPTQRDARTFLDDSKAPREIIGNDPKILQLLETIDRIADAPATVLLEGESGTGKELAARALHYRSSRRDRPFVAVNCAAIPQDLLESELFGHEKGAYTSAGARYVGLIEQGDKGTIFLDEISELAYPLQAKLLRFLQSHEFHRLGGKAAIKVDVRIVAATSKNLKSMSEEGKFQEALYYRLNVIPIRMPALRERKEDIPLLADHFANRFVEIYKKSVSIDFEVYELLKEYSFPGNARELENLIHRLVALSPDGTIRAGDLPHDIRQEAAGRISIEKDPFYRILQTPPIDLKDLRHRKAEIRRALAEQERELARRAIEEAGGNITEAARRMGVHRITLHLMLNNAKKTNRRA